MAEVLRVVSGPTASRSTVLDLLSAVNVLSDFSAPAPRLRRASASSFQADGSVDAATAWDDRELTITFAVQGSSEDQAAFVSQILGRTFSRPCWLEFQGGTTKPIFFRTRATTLDAVEDFGPSNPGVRLITVVVPADPFAYGLPESGTATVLNDPTATNGMRFTISGVKGDVPTPALIRATNSDVGSSALWASSTDATLRNAPIDFTSDALEPGNDWTRTTVSDATAIGGSHLRVTASTSAGWGLAMFPSMPAGEFRVMVRAKTSSAARISAAPWASLATSFQAAPVVDISTNGWKWHDLGVVRLPSRGRRLGVFSPGLIADGILALNVTRSSGTPQVDLDHVVLVPSPGADGAQGRLLLISGAALISQYVVDGPDGAVYGSGSGGTIGWSIAQAGGLPCVSPGSDNLIVNLPTLIPFSMPDKKATSVAVTWSYFPRYLTLRGD